MNVKRMLIFVESSEGVWWTQVLEKQGFVMCETVGLQPQIRDGVNKLFTPIHKLQVLIMFAARDGEENTGDPMLVHMVLSGNRGTPNHPFQWTFFPYKPTISGYPQVWTPPPDGFATPQSQDVNGYVRKTAVIGVSGHQGSREFIEEARKGRWRW